MKAVLLFAMLFILAGCKKDEFNTSDKTVYRWQRDLYRQRIPNPITGETPYQSGVFEDIFIKRDYVFLTGGQVKNQRDSIKKASGRLFWYSYQKMK